MLIFVQSHCIRINSSSFIITNTDKEFKFSGHRSFKAYKREALRSYQQFTRLSEVLEETRSQVSTEEIQK